MNFLIPSVSACVLLLSLFAAGDAVSADNDDSGGTLGLYHENDMFAGTDRYYTSGVKLSWSSPNLERFSDSPYASPFLPLFDLLPYINETEYQKNLVFAIGQNIYARQH
jgi:lipid A 3-O-deacylase